MNEAGVAGLPGTAFGRHGEGYLRFSFANSLDNADAVAHAVCGSIATTGRPDAMNQLFDAYDSLTPADLRRVASRYFAAENQTVVTLQSETPR